MRRIALSSENLRALREISFLDSRLAKMVHEWVPSGSRRDQYSIPAEACEDIRELLTRILAEVGFDESYELTPRGASLEELIDRFADN